MVGGTLSIQNNAALVDLSGAHGIEWVERLVVRDNPALQGSSIDALVDAIDVIHRGVTRD